ncbi:MAG: response regulator [Ktedonobacterales bacterium]|nr:response regulator [Ktedonobacterales bacterium]
MMTSLLAHTLIVDDDREIRATLTALLKEEGYPVAVAGDGAQALPILRDDPHPLVVLLDVMMPHMSGIEVLRAAEADPRLLRKRAYLLTTANAHILTPDFRALLARLAIPIVPKPFDADHLLELVERAAERLRDD